jgi:DNA repair protein RadC
LLVVAEKVMKIIPSKQLALYRDLIKSENLAEVQLNYRSKVKLRDLKTVVSSHDSFEILKPLYQEDKIEYVEQFIILLLNRASKPLGWVKISQGGITGTVADPRLIFQASLLTNSTAIILSHNHPSGNLHPSQTDIELTRRIKEGGKILEIGILDHLIICSDSYYSFADEGMI